MSSIGAPLRSSLTRCNSYDRDRQLIRKKRQWQRRRDSSVGSSGKYDSGAEDNINMLETEEPTDISVPVCLLDTFEIFLIENQTKTVDTSLLPLCGSQFEFQFQLDTK